MRCRAMQNAKKAMAATDSKREFRLFHQWEKNSRSYGALMVNHFGMSQLQDIQRDKKVVVFKCGFDYNQRVFVLICPPSLLDYNSFMRDRPSEVASSAIFKSNHVVVLLEYHNTKESVVVCSCKVCPLSELRQYVLMPHPPMFQSGCSWEDLVKHLFSPGNLPLKSSVFDSWKPLQQHNFEQQLGLLKKSPHYQQFVCSALRINTATQSRHQTHIVAVKGELGMGLGEILSITEYKVLTLLETKTLLQQGSSGDPAIATTFENEFKALSAESKKSDSVTTTTTTTAILRLAILPLFSFMSVASLFQLAFDIDPDNLDVVSQSEADAMANHNFSELTKISFPPVTSPELH